MLQPSMATYSRVYGVRGDTRPHLMALALLLRLIRDPRPCGEFDRIMLAKRVFGEPKEKEVKKEKQCPNLGNIGVSGDDLGDGIIAVRRV